MKEISRPLSCSALSAAVGVVLLYLAALLPTGKIFMVCAASLAVVFLRMRFDWRWALGCFAVTGLLGLLLSPSKVPAILYVVFFGYYPLVKLPAERIASPIWRWAAKLGCFNLAMAGLYAAFHSVLPAQQGPLAAFPALMLLCANAAFVIYDLALRQGILYYLRHISGRMK